MNDNRKYKIAPSVKVFFLSGIKSSSEITVSTPSPEHVLKQLNDYKSQYELEADDELWLVVDKDRWTEAMLSRVATECSQEVAMHMALSNPCFELWLLLHPDPKNRKIIIKQFCNEDMVIENVVNYEMCPGNDLCEYDM